MADKHKDNQTKYAGFIKNLSWRLTIGQKQTRLPIWGKGFRGNREQGNCPPDAGWRSMTRRENSAANATDKRLSYLRTNYFSASSNACKVTLLPAVKLSVRLHDVRPFASTRTVWEPSGSSMTDGVFPMKFPST